MPRRLPGFSLLHFAVLGVTLALTATVACWIVPPAGQPAAAQLPGLVQVTLFGSIRDSIGAPPPLFSTVEAVVEQPVITASGTVQTPYCAAGASDATGSYHLVLQSYVVGCVTPGSVLSLHVNNVPAMQTFILPPFSGAYEFDVTLAVPLGGQPLPAAPLILPPAVLPAPSSATAGTTPLNPGCSQVIVSLGPGATPAQLAADVAAPTALVAIWHYDNASQRFTGYFPDPAAPSDFTTLAPVDTVFICVSSPTSVSAL